MSSTKPRVALFTSCLVDQFYPQVGESLVTVLRRLGVEVTYDPAQTCRGQPAFNTGFRPDGRDFPALAQRPFRERWASFEGGGSAARRAD